MSPSILFQILERFPQSKWAMTSSAKHKEAMAKLEDFTDEELAAALDVMKRTLARTMVTPDQLAAKGCLAVTRSCTTRWAFGSPFIARAMASFVAV